MSQRNIGLGPLLELNMNQDFWKSLFMFAWNDNPKHWDSTGQLVLMEFSIPLLGHCGPEPFEGTPALYLLGFLQKPRESSLQLQFPIFHLDENLQIQRLNQDLGTITSTKERSSESPLLLQPLMKLCWCINCCACSKSKAQNSQILLQRNPWHLYHWP